MILKKIQIVVFVGILILTSMSAIKAGDPLTEEFELIWEVTHDNGFDDYIHSVTEATDDEGFVAAGMYKDNEDIYHMRVMKINDAGDQVIWDHTFYTGVLWDIITVSDGYITTGSYYDTSNDEYSVIIIKINEDGYLEWDEKHGTSSYLSCGFCVESTSDGGYIIGGCYGRGNGNWDLYLIKTYSDGTKEWEHTYGDAANDPDEVHSVKETPDGDFIATGFRYDWYQGNEEWNRAQCILLKTNSDGWQTWIQTYGMFDRYNQSIGVDVELTGNNGYIVCGENGFWDHPNFWLLRTNQNGMEIWSKDFEQGTFSGVNFIGNEYFVAAGMTLEGPDNYNPYILKVDLAGNPVASGKFEGGDTLTLVRDMEYIGSNEFIIAGTVHDGIGDSYFLRVSHGENNPPNTPARPTGETDGFSGHEYEYITTTTDPEVNDVQYCWDWDDGTPLEWTDWYLSGENCRVSHSWDIPGIYSVRVKARDTYLDESEWSEFLSVTMNPFPIDVFPDDYYITIGSYVSGNLESLVGSDNSYLIFKNPGVLQQSQIILYGEATYDNPLSLTFKLESHVSTYLTVEQTIELYNYDTESYEEIDTRVIPNFDIVVQEVINDNPSRFIHSSTLNMKARISYILTSHLIPSIPYYWTANLDQAKWTIL